MGVKSGLCFVLWAALSGVEEYFGNSASISLSGSDRKQMFTLKSLRNVNSLEIKLFQSKIHSFPERKFVVNYP